MRRGQFHSTTLIAVAMLLLFLFISAGYLLLLPGPVSSPAPGDTQSELQKNRALWAATAPASFRYVVERTCFCRVEYTTPYVATEQSGQRHAAFRVEIEQSDGTFTATPDTPMWITDIFEQIEIASESRDTRRVEVTYDPHFGFPIAVDIQNRYADGHYQYFVRDFEVLEHRTE